MRKTGLDELQVGLKIGITSATSGQGWATLKAESKEELKSLLLRVKEEGEKASLKLNIKKKKLRLWHPASLRHGR